MATDKEWQKFLDNLPTGKGKKHTLACGVAVGDIIETPYGEPGKVIGMSHKGMDVDVKGLKHPKFIPFAGNTNLEVLKQESDS